MKSSGKNLSVIIFTLLSLGIAGGGFARVNPPEQLVYRRADPVISPRLQKTLTVTSGYQPLHVWVFFTDKGFTAPQVYNQKILAARDEMSLRVLRRRAKTRLVSNLVDFRDLPVFQSYIESVQVISGVERVRTVSKWLNGVSIAATPNAIRQLVRLSFVCRIQLVRQGKWKQPATTTSRVINPSPRTDQQHLLNYGASFSQLDQINVVAAHDSGYSGAGIRVLMLDTGYYLDHVAIDTSRVIAQWDFINNDGNTQNEGTDYYAQHNHGTATTSILGAAVDGQLYGPAYQCEFLLAKTEDVTQEHPIEEDFFVQGLEWGEQHGADIVSSSLAYNDWYTPGDFDGETAVTTVAVDQIVTDGVVVVNAAGNYGFNGLAAPADADSVITCGAVDPDGVIASFSSRGPTADGRIKPEVVAQGVSVYHAVTSGTQDFNYGSGTSYSTPLIAGVAALILEAHPDWTPMMVRTALMQTADNRRDPNNDYGWGLINAMAAMHYRFPAVTLGDPVQTFQESGSTNPNGQVNPGESGTLYITLTNSGIEEVSNVSGVIHWNNPFVQFIPNEMSWSAIPSQGDAQSSFPVTVTVDSMANNGMAVPFDLDITSASSSGPYSTTLHGSITIGTPQVLLVDLDRNHNSAIPVQNDLENMGIAARRIYRMEYDQSINETAVYLFLGMSPRKSRVSDRLSQYFSDYLDHGGHLYMEGGDTWAFDSLKTLHSYFFVSGGDNGGDDLDVLEGVPDSPLDGYRFQYGSDADNHSVDHLVPDREAVPWMQNANPTYFTLVSYDAGSYRTLASSLELGGIQSHATGYNSRNTVVRGTAEYLGVTAHWIKGDITGDKTLDIRDVVSLLTGVLPDPAQANERQRFAADIDRDGEVTEHDFRLLTHYILTH